MNYIKKLTKAREASSLFISDRFVCHCRMYQYEFSGAVHSIAACFNDSVVFTLLAVGMAFAIFIGEIDISVGANLGFYRFRCGFAAARRAQLGILFCRGHSDRRGDRTDQWLGCGGAAYSVSDFSRLAPAGVCCGADLCLYRQGMGGKSSGSLYCVCFRPLIGDLTVFYTVAIVSVIIIHIVLTHQKKGNILSQWVTM